MSSLVLVVLALGISLGLAASGDSQERAPHERIDLPSVAACGGCHTEVTREWSRSLHARAWSNANIQRATRNFEKESCRPCHSPMPVLPTGLDRAPDYRDFNQEDGVHCLSCHGRDDGVAASRTVPDAPCQPVRDERLLVADHCYPCHQPTHQAFDEYEQSRAKELGIRCADCHMPSVRRADGSLGRSHGPHGGFDETFVRRAIHWEAEREQDRLVLEVRNRAGHKFPGEIPSRVFRIRVHQAGELVEERILRKPHKKEDRVDDRLLPDETRTFVFELSPAPVRLELLFQPLPLMGPEECFVLGEWSDG